MPSMGQRRQWPRLRFSGEATWRVEDVEYHLPLLNLSVGGAALHDPHGRLKRGERLQLSFVLEGTLILSSVEAEVVYRVRDRVGVRFPNPSPALVEELQQLTRSDTPPGSA
jgi:hypothetical protein